MRLKLISAFSVDHLTVTMNGQGVIALAFLLAVVSQAQGQGRGVPGGLSEQQMAGPGEQALVAKVRIYFYP